MDWSKAAEELGREISGWVLPRVPMREHTTWRVGGPADLLLIPRATEDIARGLAFARARGLPVTVIGNGSNVLVRDGGIRGLTLKMAGGMKEYAFHGARLSAEAGVMLPVLARAAARLGLSGLEFAPGIPASLGGAVVMNAGAFGQQLADLVAAGEAFDFEGKKHLLRASELAFGYRWSSLGEQELVIFRVALRLAPGDTSLIVARMERNLALRKRLQPLNLPSAGSVFRNPPGDYAGRLIELAGLKGLRCGDAQVSEKHANFIVNLGNATAAQVVSLMEHVREKVREKFGVELVPEVRLVGED